MRIDLFVSPGCPECPPARAVVEGFARAHPGVEVHEWDLSQDPGPAVGRGIFATPTVLLDGARILPGVPSAFDLERHLAGARDEQPRPTGQPALRGTNCRRVR